MNWTDIESELIRDEGVSLRAYTCPSGYLTIGVGHRLRENEIAVSEISLETAGAILRRDIERAVHDLECVFGIHCMDAWSEDRQHALINMMFQLGRTRFLSFENMIAAIQCGDWQEAACQCLDSKYARKDAPERARRVAQKLYPGE